MLFAQKLSHKDTFSPRHATLSYLYDSKNDVIDQAIVIYFKAPFSFTAEDVVEFQCHGGVVVARMVIDELLHVGAKLAQPGEFSKRAFLNGRIDLSEAEAIASLIETKSIDAAKILARQMKGDLKHFVNDTRDALLEILAFVEVNIDYAEEDLPSDIMRLILEKLLHVKALLQKTYETSKQREGLISGFKVAIVGKPNVGKSSLLNMLLNYDRAIISDIAGTTRDTIEEEVRVGTHLIKIVDTAGIREASDSIEKIGIERSIQAMDDSEIIIAMFDNASICDEQDAKMLSILNNYKKDKHIVMALNKCDLDNKFDTSLLGEDYVSLSCHRNGDVIIERLKLLLDKTPIDDGLILTTKRQMEAVKFAFEEIQNSEMLLSEGELELFAFHINTAIESIASISRPFERDEILDKMFGSFCLGK